MFQENFSSYNKRITVMGLLIVREDMTVCGHGIYDNSLYFLLSFAVNLKLLLKNKVYSKEEEEEKKKQKHLKLPDPGRWSSIANTLECTSLNDGNVLSIT